MSSDEVRRGVAQAKQNEAALGFCGLELIVVFAALASYLGDWKEGAGCVFALFVTLAIPYARIATAVALAIGFAACAWWLVNAFTDGGATPYVVAAICLAMGAGANVGAVQWIQDTRR
jgi:hypothetical protein